MKARDRATWDASGARAGDPHGNHLHPKWSSVPPDHLGHTSILWSRSVDFRASLILVGKIMSVRALPWPPPAQLLQRYRRPLPEDAERTQIGLNC